MDLHICKNKKKTNLFSFSSNNVCEILYTFSHSNLIINGYKEKKLKTIFPRPYLTSIDRRKRREITETAIHRDIKDIFSRKNGALPPFRNF